MADPGELYTLVDDAATLADATPVLVVHLGGFIDAGAVGEVVVDTMLERNGGDVVARFDVDRIVDLRARRPRMLFEREGWRSYEPHELVLRRMADAAGVPYLLLHGPEPDRYWDAFGDAVLELVDRFSVRLVLTAHGIPTAVPHTRPIGHTEHATDPALLSGTARSDLDSVEVPGSVEGLLEYRMGERGVPAAGAAVHVPHYLSGSRYSEGALYALEWLGTMSGLTLPTASLAEPVMADREAIAAEVAGSEEIAQVVAALEQGYDEAEAARGRQDTADGADTEPDTAVPSADEIGAQVEDFLRRHGDGGDGEPRWPGSPSGPDA